MLQRRRFKQSWAGWGRGCWPEPPARLLLLLPGPQARRSLPARAVAPEPAWAADGGGVDYWQDQPATPWGNEEEEEEGGG